MHKYTIIFVRLQIEFIPLSRTLNVKGNTIVLVYEHVHYNILQ